MNQEKKQTHQEKLNHLANNSEISLNSKTTDYSMANAQGYITTKTSILTHNSTIFQDETFIKIQESQRSKKSGNMKKIFIVLQPINSIF